MKLIIFYSIKSSCTNLNLNGHMRRIIYLVVFLFFLSCSEENNLNMHEWTYLDFENNLKSDMSYDAIVAKFGEPWNDIGSGIQIYVYQLTDSTEIWIGYVDNIIYARHMDENQQILKNII